LYVLVSFVEHGHTRKKLRGRVVLFEFDPEGKRVTASGTRPADVLGWTFGVVVGHGAEPEYTHAGVGVLRIIDKRRTGSAAPRSRTLLESTIPYDVASSRRFA
jgi:hypothetical protein